MKASSPSEGSPRQPAKDQTYAELVELAKLFLANPADREVEEKFATSCLAQIKKMVQAHVHWKFFPEIVVDDAVSLAQHNWVCGIRDLRSAESLKPWLKKISRRAVVTEFLRTVIGRAAYEREHVPLQSEDADGKPIETLDLKESKEAARRYGAAAASSLEDFRGKVMTEEMVRAILRIHMGRAKNKRDLDSAVWIQVLLLEGITEGEPIDEIARRRRTSRADVLHLFKHDGRVLHGIYRELGGVS